MDTVTDISVFYVRTMQYSLSVKYDAEPVVTKTSRIHETVLFQTAFDRFHCKQPVCNGTYQSWCVRCRIRGGYVRGKVRVAQEVLHPQC